MGNVCRCLGIMLAVGALGGAELQAVPLGTAITYQGQLKQSGVPYGGTADLIFTLYDAPTASGNLVAGPLTLTNVAVVSGLFTVQIDFGAAAFAGDARWIDIQVRTPAGSGSYVTLSPRQPVTAVPYALKVPGLQAAGGSPASAIYVDSAGNVGLGTTTPGQRLTINGDAEFGLGSGDYHHLRIGGGNSNGFLYGSFPHFGDGIHLGYNYYADAAGANVVVHPDGGTSRITAGYGTVAIATQAPFAGEPLNRLVVESNGNVRLGSNTSLYAPGGEENLRMLRGTVSAAGGILAGSGFTVSHNTTGLYGIIFNSLFAAAPTVTVTLQSNSSTIATNPPAVNFFVVTTRDLAGNPVDRDFHFIAIGPR